MADLIDRQAALDAIEAYFGDLPIVVHHDMLQLIKDLPSAQQYMTATSNTMVSDTVKIPVMDGTAERLPPAHPEITLESAIDYLHSIGWMQEHDRSLTESAHQEHKDIVEVVRCKDCKHHEGECIGMVYCPDQVGGWVREDFFCADGKRRDDG